VSAGVRDDHDLNMKDNLTGSKNNRRGLRQYVLEIECTIVVESRSDDPDEVGDDFAARLYELAPSGEHMLGLSVQVSPIPELREALN
jgi:hypothetical protein